MAFYLAFVERQERVTRGAGAGQEVPRTGTDHDRTAVTT